MTATLIRNQLDRGIRSVASVPATLVVMLLIATAFLPFARTHFGNAGVLGIALAGGLVALLVTPTAFSALSDRPRHTQRLGLRGVIEMALYLSPVLLLTAVFPFATQRIIEIHIGGASLTSLLLACSVTAPWSSQAVCLPLYRAIGALVPEGNMDAIQRRFCQVWPSTFVQSLPAVVIFAVAMQLVMSWSWTAFTAYFVLSVLHVAFAQSLVIANVGRLRMSWALAWTCYAGVLFVVPAAWFLPPIVGLLSQLILLRNYLPHLQRRVHLAIADVATDLLRGVLLGTLLWADKFLLYLKSHGEFNVNAVFIGLFPAILAYNYYFVRLAPQIDRSVMDVRNAMETQPSHVVARHSGAVSDVVSTSIVRTGLVGAVTTLAVSVLVGVYVPNLLAMVVAVAFASFLFMMTTLVTYKLDYIGYRAQAQVFGAAHLIACVVLFLVLPAGPALYVWLAAVELVIFATALSICLNEWRSAEYALFWRHATAW